MRKKIKYTKFKKYYVMFFKEDKGLICIEYDTLLEAQEYFNYLFNQDNYLVINPKILIDI